MAYQIQLKPSNHQFSAEARSSVLEAGLGEGLNLDHGCANGSCGECKARLIQGDIAQSGHFDYRFTDAEKAQGYFLMCCHRPLSDLVVEAHESDQAADIPEQHITAKVSKVEYLQKDVVQLSVRTPRSRGLHFLAGQGVSLHFDGMRDKHLPIASCPCDSNLLRFHLRRRENDPFSEFIFERLKKNREVVLTGPIGNFTLQEASERPIIFVAWETGFAPIASLIDHAIQKDPERTIHLYWLSAIRHGHYLANYCRAWCDALDNFRYRAIYLQSIGDLSYTKALVEIINSYHDLQQWDLYITAPVAEQYKVSAYLRDINMLDGQTKIAYL
jgi:CDP-4-dehydro-6-deoxyglucose reductase